MTVVDTSVYDSIIEAAPGILLAAGGLAVVLLVVVWVSRIVLAGIVKDAGNF